jgi:hypothetical protein
MPNLLIKKNPKLPEHDHWAKDGMVFICDGRGYCVAPTGATVCIGPVDDDGNELQQDLNLTPPVNNQPPEAPVTPDQPILSDVVGDVTVHVTARIKELSVQHSSTRAIARILQGEGFQISHMTVQRRLQGKLL